MHLYIRAMVQDSALDLWGTAAAIDDRKKERDRVRYELGAGSFTY